MNHTNSDFNPAAPPAMASQSPLPSPEDLCAVMPTPVLMFKGDLDHPVYMNAAALELLGEDRIESALAKLHNSALFGSSEEKEKLLGTLQSAGYAEFSTQPRCVTDTIIGNIYTSADQNGVPFYITFLRLEAKLKKQKQFAQDVNSVITHELRTPLTSIKGALEMLQPKVVGPLSDKATALLKIAHTNCDRMLELIQDMLDSNEQTQTKKTAEREVTALAPVLSNIATSLQGYGTYHGVEIRLKSVDDTLAVNVVPSHLIKIVTNLISNAVKASQKGQHVEFWAETAEDKIKILVKDNGSGIPAEIQDRLFDKFTRSQWLNEKSTGSSGLGLNIVKTLAETMDGNVSFVSDAGKGTTFCVTLPKALLT